MGGDRFTYKYEQYGDELRATLNKHNLTHINIEQNGFQELDRKGLHAR